MFALIALAISLAQPAPATAEVLWRTWKNPKPSPVKLSKKFYKTVVEDTTCWEQRCQDVEERVCQNVCRTEYNWKNVCRQDYVCETDGNGQQQCNWKEICETQYVPEEKCEEQCRYETVNRCDSYPYSCREERQVLIRDWKVLFKPVFDARTVPTKGKDEKFTITLEGDEKSPVVTIQKNVGPFEYLPTEPRFSADSKTIDVEFKLKE